jgi:hypothetical protein
MAVKLSVLRSGRPLLPRILKEPMNSSGTEAYQNLCSICLCIGNLEYYGTPIYFCLILWRICAMEAGRKMQACEMFFTLQRAWNEGRAMRGE